MQKAPLPETLRPKLLKDFIGQVHLVGKEGVINKLLKSTKKTEFFPSLIFWGPPGSGKTTLARIISKQLGREYYEFSAVSTKIKEIEEIIKKSRPLIASPIFFIDEIHRFNKAQQDKLLPFVERGDIIFIGATTENPSFEVIGPLLSRCRVFVLNQLSDKELNKIVARGEKALRIKIDKKARKFLLEPELKEVEEKFKKASLEIPNLPADDVKDGKDESENEIVRTEGKPRDFDFKVKDHLELGQHLGIIDVERASKVSGARFGYLKGDGVLLELAIVNFALETLIKEGFTPVIPPVLIKRQMMQGMGYLEHEGEEDMYTLDKDGLVLVGTSEQSVGPMHAGEILDAGKLPLRYVAFSTCFRREAGSYGKDTRGIFRVHQFDKVEMFSFTKLEEGDREHEFFLSLEEKFLKDLGLPYQVVKMCTGDLGAPAARKYDLEAWIPSQGKYRELTSTSTTTDFQSRRLGVKYQDKGETKYVHMLNGTAFAIGRTIIAILENYQQKDGSVEIPKILQKWVGKDTIRS